MKILIYVAFLIIGILTINIIPNISSFEKTIEHGVGRAIAIDSDQNLFISGDCLSTGRKCNGFVFKVNPKGDVVWKHEIDYIDKTVVCDIEIGQDDNIYVSINRNLAKILVLCLSRDGKKLWLNEGIYASGPNAGKNLKLNSTGEAFFINGSQKIIKFNTDFSKSKRIYVSGDDYLSISSFILEKENNFVTVGHVKNSIQVLKVDSTGNIKQSYNFPENRLSYGNDIIKVGLDKYAILGTSKLDPKNNTHNLFVSLLDENLAPIWAKEIHQEYYGNDYKKIDVINDNEIVICTMFKDTKSSNYVDAQIIKLNFKGEIVSEEYWGTERSEYPFDLVTSANQIIFTGQKSDSVWVVSAN